MTDAMNNGNNNLNTSTYVCVICGQYSNCVIYGQYSNCVICGQYSNCVICGQYSNCDLWIIQ